MSQYLRTSKTISHDNSSSNTMTTGRISNRKQIYLQFITAHYNNYDASMSRRLAIAIKRFIHSKPKYARKSPAFVADIRSKLLCLHEYNLHVAEFQSNKYPKSRQLDELLILYVELECELLYRTTEPVDPKKELEVEQRVLKILHLILHDVVHKIDVPLNTTRDICLKIILRLLVNVRKDIVEKNNVIANAIVKLVDKIGYLNEVERFKEKMTTSIYLDACLQEPDALELRRKLTTSDYGSDSFDSDEDDDIIETSYKQQKSSLCFGNRPFLDLVKSNTENNLLDDAYTPKYAEHVPLTLVKNETNDSSCSTPSDYGGSTSYDYLDNNSGIGGGDGDGDSDRDLQIIDDSKNGCGGAPTQGNVGNSAHQQTNSEIIEILDDDDDDDDGGGDYNSNVVVAKPLRLDEIKVENDENHPPNSVFDDDEHSGGGFGSTKDLKTITSDCCDNFTDQNGSVGNYDQSEESATVISSDLPQEDHQDGSRTLSIECNPEIDDVISPSDEDLNLNDAKVESEEVTSPVFGLGIVKVTDIVHPENDNRVEDVLVSANVEETYNEILEEQDDLQDMELEECLHTAQVLERLPEKVPESCSEDRSLDEIVQALQDELTDKSDVVESEESVADCRTLTEEIVDDLEVIPVQADEVSEEIITNLQITENDTNVAEKLGAKTTNLKITNEITNVDEVIKKITTNLQITGNDTSVAEELGAITTNSQITHEVTNVDEVVKEITTNLQITGDTTNVAEELEVISQKIPEPSVNVESDVLPMNSAPGPNVCDEDAEEVAGNAQIPLEKPVGAVDVARSPAILPEEIEDSTVTTPTPSCLYYDDKVSSPTATPLVVLADVAANQQTLDVVHDRNLPYPQHYPVDSIAMDCLYNESSNRGEETGTEDESGPLIIDETPRTRKSKVRMGMGKRADKQKRVSRKLTENFANKRVTRNSASKAKSKCVVEEKVADSKFSPHDFIALRDSTTPTLTNNVYAQKPVTETKAISEESNDSCDSTLIIDEGKDKGIDAIYEQETIDDGLELFRNDFDQEETGVSISIPEKNEDSLTFPNFHILKQMETFEVTQDGDVKVERNDVQAEVTTPKQIIHSIEHILSSPGSGGSQKEQYGPLTEIDHIRSNFEAIVSDNENKTIILDLDVPEVEEATVTDYTVDEVDTATDAIVENHLIDHSEVKLSEVEVLLCQDLDPPFRSKAAVKFFDEDVSKRTVKVRSKSLCFDLDNKSADTNKATIDYLDLDDVPRKVKLKAPVDGGESREDAEMTVETVASEYDEEILTECTVKHDESVICEEVPMDIEPEDHTADLSVEEQDKSTPVADSNDVPLGEGLAVDSSVEELPISALQIELPSVAADVTIDSAQELDLPPVLTEQLPTAELKPPTVTESDQPPLLERQIQPNMVPVTLDLPKDGGTDVSTYPLNSMPPIITSPIKEKPIKGKERSPKCRNLSDNDKKASLESTIKKVIERVKKPVTITETTPEKNAMVSERPRKSNSPGSKLKSDDKKEHHRSSGKSRSSDKDKKIGDCKSGRSSSASSKSVEKKVSPKRREDEESNSSRKRHSRSRSASKTIDATNDDKHSKSLDSKSRRNHDDVNGNKKKLDASDSSKRHTSIEREKPSRSFRSTAKSEPIIDSGCNELFSTFDEGHKISGSEFAKTKLRATDKICKSNESKKADDQSGDIHKDKKRERMSETKDSTVISKDAKDTKSPKTPKDDKKVEIGKINDHKSDKDRKRDGKLSPSKDHKSSELSAKRSRSREEHQSDKIKDGKYGERHRSHSKGSSGHRSDSDKDKKSHRRKNEKMHKSHNGDKAKSESVGENKEKRKETKEKKPETSKSKRPHHDGDTHSPIKKRREIKSSEAVPTSPREDRAPEVTTAIEKPVAVNEEQIQEVVDMDLEETEPENATSQTNDLYTDQGYESVASQSINTPASVASQYIKTPTEDDGIAMETYTSQSDAASTSLAEFSHMESPTKMFLQSEPPDFVTGQYSSKRVSICGVITQSVNIVNRPCSTEIQQGKTCVAFAFSEDGDNDRSTSLGLEEISPRKFSSDQSLDLISPTTSISTEMTLVRGMVNSTVNVMGELPDCNEIDKSNYRQGTPITKIVVLNQKESNGDQNLGGPLLSGSQEDNNILRTISINNFEDIELQPFTDSTLIGESSDFDFEPLLPCKKEKPDDDFPMEQPEVPQNGDDGDHPAKDLEQYADPAEITKSLKKLSDYGGIPDGFKSNSSNAEEQSFHQSDPQADQYNNIQFAVSSAVSGLLTVIDNKREHMICNPIATSPRPKTPTIPNFTLSNSESSCNHVENQKVVVEPVVQCPITPMEERDSYVKEVPITMKNDERQCYKPTEFIQKVKNNKNKEVHRAKSQDALDMENLFKRKNNKSRVVTPDQRKVTQQKSSTKSPQQNNNALESNNEISDNRSNMNDLLHISNMTTKSKIRVKNNLITEKKKSPEARKSDFSATTGRLSKRRRDSDDDDPNAKPPQPPVKIDTDKIFDELKKQPVNPYFIENNKLNKNRFSDDLQSAKLDVKDRTSFMVQSAQHKSEPSHRTAKNLTNKRHNTDPTSNSTNRNWSSVNGGVFPRPQSSSHSNTIGYVQPSARLLSIGEVANLTSTRSGTIANPKLSSAEEDDLAWRKGLDGIIDNQDLFDFHPYSGATLDQKRMKKSGNSHR